MKITFMVEKNGGHMPSISSGRLIIVAGSYHIAGSLEERVFGEFTLFKHLAEKSLANK